MSLIRNNSQQQGCCGDMCMFSSFMGRCFPVTYVHTRHLGVQLAQRVSQVLTTAPDDGDLQKQIVLTSHDFSPPQPRIAVAMPVQTPRTIKRNISFLPSLPVMTVFCNEGRDSEMGRPGTWPPIYGFPTQGWAWDLRSVCLRRAHVIHC